MNAKDIVLKIAVPKAIKKAQHNGLTIGQLVAHPSDPIAYVLKEIVDTTAIVWIPEQNGTEKEFPLCELFDLHVAQKIALEEALAQVQGDMHNAMNN